ncbi:MAG: protein translocase subunit SecF [Christensenellaceae bacterium]|jgi:preprotein translocase subunit SecF|nr:protein translocase subunit SecF [Christensenellaceae bacterium]
MNKKLSLSNFKVFNNANYWLLAPLVIIFVALVCGTVYSTSGNKYDGFANVGIDFRGGTVLTVEIEAGPDMTGDNYEANEKIIKEIIEKNGGSPSDAQTRGTNAIIVRYPNSLNGENFNDDSKTLEMISINNQIAKDVEAGFKERYGDDVEITASAELINATASSDLISKAALSVSLAILLILIYVIIRFDLFSGLAAIIALIHDLIIMFAGVIILRIPINSSLIAAIITILAYSINNTIIVFDRVRDYMKPLKTQKARIDIAFIVDSSVKDTLNRSILTTITTLITVTALACVGIQSLNDFVIPIIIGLIAGAYSSVLIAPSVWGLMQKAKIKRKKKEKSEKAPVYSRSR